LAVQPQSIATVASSVLLAAFSINQNVFISVRGTKTASIYVQMHGCATARKIVIVSGAHQVSAGCTSEIKI
jgi:hypothetical protein